MEHGAQDNAMSEIALALAMAFFSIMVLMMVSMGVGQNDQESTVTLIGGAGNDHLIGGEGNDTYIFEEGVDVIQNYNQGASADTLLFGSSLSYNDLWFRQKDIDLDGIDDLEISVIGTNDKAIISSWYDASSNNHISQISTANGNLAFANVQSLVDAMASFETSNSDFSISVNSDMPNDSALTIAIDTAWDHS